MPKWSVKGISFIQIDGASLIGYCVYEVMAADFFAIWYQRERKERRSIDKEEIKAKGKEKEVNRQRGSCLTKGKQSKGLLNKGGAKKKL